jgi:hypothetical protein
MLPRVLEFDAWSAVAERAAAHPDADSSQSPAGNDAATENSGALHVPADVPVAGPVGCETSQPEFKEGPSSEVVSATDSNSPLEVTSSVRDSDGPGFWNPADPGSPLGLAPGRRQSPHNPRSLPVRIFGRAA